MAEFKVVIEGVELPEETRKSINSSIQRAVLSHLADIDVNESPVVVIPDRRKWRGIWIGPGEAGVELQQQQFQQHFGGH